MSNIEIFNYEKDGIPDGGTAQAPGVLITWQRGSLQERGRNGAFLIEVLEIAVKQLEYYQTRAFACEENTKALAHLNEAIAALNSRLDRRKQEGITNFSDYFRNSQT